MEHSRRTSAPSATVLVRLMVGAVFLAEGIQKILFPEQLGAGRFLKIGLPMPELLGPFVGTFEILLSALELAGLLTRIAVILLLAVHHGRLAASAKRTRHFQRIGRTPAAGRDASSVEVAPARARSRGIVGFTSLLQGTGHAQPRLRHKYRGTR